MPIGLYRIPDEDAEKLGYEALYVVGEYEIKEITGIDGSKKKVIIIGRETYPYEEGRLIEVNPADFKDYSGKDVTSFFKKYGVEVDLGYVVRVRKGTFHDVVSIHGGKVKED